MTDRLARHLAATIAAEIGAQPAQAQAAIDLLDGGATVPFVARYRKEAGTDKKPFEIHVISMDGFTLDGVKRLEDQGITDVIVGFRNAYEKDNQTLQQKLDALRGYADRVIAKLR